MVENEGRRAGLRLREIREFLDLDLGLLDLSSPCEWAGRDVQEAVGSEKSELGTEMDTECGRPSPLTPSLPSD